MNVRRVIENQRDIFNILKRAKDTDRLSHAYLFYGASGTGKKEMAYALACLLYCENGGCLECETCKSILSGNNLNISYVGKPERKSGISKEQIQDLQEEFSKTSLVNGKRIYIVDGIDTASTAAQNSLLKFIEEPENQEAAVGIFLAEELSNVLVTIQSRCELVYFKEVPKKIFISNLLEEGLEEFDASLIATLTNNLDETMEYYKSEEYKIAKDMFLELINSKTKLDGTTFYLKYANYSSLAGGQSRGRDLTNDLKIVSMITEWLIIFLEDALFHYKDNESLILKTLYDKIKAYKQSKKNLKHRLEGILSSNDKLRYNVSPKNILFEVLIYFLE